MKIDLFVIRLGGFHTLMSFLECLGNLMADSGLTEALQLIYAENTVPHLLTGKAYNRALRGHQIVDLALHTILLKDIIQTIDTDPSLVESMLRDECKGQLDASSLKSNIVLCDVEKALHEKKKSLKENRTAYLWLQYMNVVQIVLIFLRSERLGKWDARLVCLDEMLPCMRT